MEGGGALVAKIPSATSKLTQSQEMAEVVFNGAYGKHSNLELLFLRHLKYGALSQKTNGYQKILLKNML